MNTECLDSFRIQCEAHLPQAIDEILSKEKDRKLSAIGFITTDDFYGFYLCWDYENTNIRESFEWQEASYPEFLYQPLVEAVDSCKEIDFTTPSDEKWDFAQEILSILGNAIRLLPEKIFQKNDYSRTDILFFATMSDGDYVDEMLDESLVLLNPREIVLAYRRREQNDEA